MKSSHWRALEFGLDASFKYGCADPRIAVLLNTKTPASARRLRTELCTAHAQIADFSQGRAIFLGFIRMSRLRWAE